MTSLFSYECRKVWKIWFWLQDARRMTEGRHPDRRQLKLLPWSRMHFKMTVFWTVVIITHVTVNWIVLRFPATSTADRRHIHCVYVSSYVFIWLKVLKSYPEASNFNFVVLLYYFIQCLGTPPFSISTISFALGYKTP